MINNHLFLSSRGLESGHEPCLGSATHAQIDECTEDARGGPGTSGQDNHQPGATDPAGGRRDHQGSRKDSLWSIAPVVHNYDTEKLFTSP